MSDDTLWEATEAVFRPSYAPTWANCAGSLLPSRYARDTAGYDAAVGTVFHWLIAAWQQEGRASVDNWLNSVFSIDKTDSNDTFEVTCDQEMFDYAEECLARYENIPGDRYVETYVDISSVTPIPKQGGTADLAICYRPNRHFRRGLQKLFPGLDFTKASLDIIDWKYGKGVQVFVENNIQILLYAWGFFVKYDADYHFEVIRLHIAQPRKNYFGVWQISRQELIDFADWIRVKAREAWKRNAPKTVSLKACQWCKVRMNCVALENAREAMADLAFDIIEEPVTVARQKEIVAADTLPARRLPPAVELNIEQLSNIAKYSRLFESWFKDVRTELTARAQQGEDVGPDWKLVEGRTRRRWKNDKRAAREMMLLGISEDELYEQKIVSPNQAEKLLRHVGVGGNLMKAYLKPLITKPPGQMTLAPVGDNRVALEGYDIDGTFDVVEDDEI